MKFKQTSLGIIAAAAVLALMPSSQAQTNTPPGGARPGGRQGQRGSPDDQMARLNEQLKLTDAQKPKVKAVLEEQQKKIQALRGDTGGAQEDRRAKRQAIQQDFHKQMQGILTPEQLKKFDEMQQQQRGRPTPGAPGAPGGNQNQNRNAPKPNPANPNAANPQQ